MRTTISLQKRFLAQIKRKVALGQMKYTTFFDNSDDLVFKDIQEYNLMFCNLPNGNTLLVTTHKWLIRFRENEVSVPNSEITGFTENSYEADLKGELNEIINISLAAKDNLEYPFDFESGSATIALMYCLSCIIDFTKN